MTETLELDCPYCGENLTEKTISVIMTHLKDKHQITLIGALSKALEDTLKEIWEVDR